MTNEKVEKLRNLLQEYNYDGYLISTADEYLNHGDIPAHAQRLKYLTGFTGSNAIILILPETNLFFTDSRYLEQAKKQLAPNSYQIFDWCSLFDRSFPWKDYFPLEPGQLITRLRIAYDPKIFSRRILKLFAFLPLKAEKCNLIDIMWQDKSTCSTISQISDYPLKFAGQSCLAKLKKCHEFIRDNHAEALIISDPSLFCWLLNIRGTDLEFTPLLLGRLVITQVQTYLFINHKNYHNECNKPVTILPESEFVRFIDKFTGKILFEPDDCSDYLRTKLEQQHYQHIKNPCRQWRAEKNDIEIANIQTGHKADAIAVCEVLAYLAEAQNYNTLSEYEVGLLLSQARSKADNYVMDSFPPICGFQENGAIIHYRATKNNSKKLEGNGLLLIDSGAQYLGCTTDITRTIPLGKISPEHKKYYSLVLKGHIALATAIFPAGKTEGAHLDILARQFLWQNGLDYGHGTGHGVGNFLNVHESPPNISMNFSGDILQPNMVLSNEPGYYLTGKFGIRIENMMYVCRAENSGFLTFKNLTLIPYARELIDFNLLTTQEINYLSSYYSQIEELIWPELTPMAQKWLSRQLEI